MERPLNINARPIEQHFLFFFTVNQETNTSQSPGRATKKIFSLNLKAKLVVLVALTFSLPPLVSIGKKVVQYLSVFNLKRVLRTACREKETRQTTAY